MKYLLDTNTISHIFKKNPIATAHLVNQPREHIAVSSVAFAEICYGLAKKPEATTLQRTAQLFFQQVQILPFNQDIAQSYGTFRAHLEKTGKNLSPLDMMIAAHADSLGLILVSNDQAFHQIDGLQVVDWTIAV
ncbi:type II toxin-antitoxin system VapC family toxin [Kingella negevensis]|uniref:Ribonuclease VapC n=1 Tax=Kingella negevensis TaxID=1522312 RepID=A0A238HIQ0_9NEIS|nr:type II toxin-antitoxin system VapC family toxin [Kingella negevensis]MDK4680159.1 type II toxin-antitoxin system VapC family toxin [Kingella negevensis]MDK4682121.1 type II toxin-antitoxin system VapC family toxin [Kingella negevensis]MDK4685578.1 type II toxin-antitoxin system VapC family toxin [Kingella negevensis]MDK4690317.1 type II toxin-antitoxin system VapC family toxin [Kingella negevensis]MDK4692336.1 type II toxin-antitoxin system VapC family toxin [Kingella negevensis]